MVIACKDGRVSSQVNHLILVPGELEVGGPAQSSRQVLCFQFQFDTCVPDIAHIGISTCITHIGRQGNLIKHITDILHVVIHSQRNAIVEEPQVDTGIP